MSYKISSFNCKNLENDSTRLKKIVEIINANFLSMILLQEFAWNGGEQDKIDKYSRIMKFPYKNWKIKTFRMSWKGKAGENWFKKRKTPENIIDDTDGEYLRNPRNDTGYAIAYDSSVFETKDMGYSVRWKQILEERNGKHNLARPPQIEMFRLAENKGSEFAVLNLHLTYSGEFDVVKRPFVNNFLPYDGLNKNLKARVDEIADIFDLYKKVNNFSTRGVHRPTLIGGDFNLSPGYLQYIEKSIAMMKSSDKINSIAEYNDNYINKRDVTVDFNKLSLFNEQKTTLHKTVKSERPNYFFNSYDHFILNVGGGNSAPIDTVKTLYEGNNEKHYKELSDHVPIYIELNFKY